MIYNTPDAKKTPVSVTVRLTATQIKNIKSVMGIRGGSNEIAVKALISSVANKNLKVW